MGTIFIITGSLLWVACGLAAYGMTLAYFQREYASISHQYIKRDKELARITLLCGPFGLAVSILSGYLKHGFLYQIKENQ